LRGKRPGALVLAVGGVGGAREELTRPLSEKGCLKGKKKTGAPKKGSDKESRRPENIAARRAARRVIELFSKNEGIKKGEENKGRQKDHIYQGKQGND